MLVHVLHRQGGDQAETFTQLSFKEASLATNIFGKSDKNIFVRTKIFLQISCQILLTSRQRQISWPLSIIVPSEMHLSSVIKHLLHFVHFCLHCLPFFTLFTLITLKNLRCTTNKYIKIRSFSSFSRLYMWKQRCVGSCNRFHGGHSHLSQEMKNFIKITFFNI